MVSHAGVADLPGEAHRRRPQLRADLGLEAGAGALLEELLVAALHRALALADGQRVAVGVAQELDLDVVGVLDELLHVALAVAEGGQSLGVGLLVGGARRLGGVDPSDAAAAAARARLDEHGAADAPRLALRLVGGGEQVAALGEGHACLAGGDAGHVLVAHALDDLGRGADEHDAALAAHARELGVLRQEAVAGVDGGRARLDGHREDGLLVEVAVLGGGARRCSMPRRPGRRGARRGPRC